ncbi:MAG: hypothetical protein V1837_00200 [Candidatus Woesearchaeota archaeon]
MKHKKKSSLKGMILTASAIGVLGVISATEVYKQSLSPVVGLENTLAPRHFRVEHEQNPANKFVIDFPVDAPGTQNVLKFIDPKANHAIVSIQQSELSGANNLTEKEYVKKVQDDIFEFLSFMRNRYGISKVYQERISPETKKIVDLELKMAQGDYSNDIVHSLNYHYGNLAKSVEAIASKLPDYGNKDLKQFYLSRFKWTDKQAYIYMNNINDELQHNAVFRLATLGQVDILPAESLPDRVAMEYLNFFLQNTPADNPIMAELSHDFQKAKRDREKVFLKIASESPDPYVAVVYGFLHDYSDYFNARGNHNFADAVNFWKASNPSKDFSLIQATPTHHALTLH